MVSFIIPVYNMEKYVNRGIDSILAQDMSEWEAIVIDDGSSDRSPVLLDEYAERDPRIRVIHKQNQGIAGAVRDGLSLATGEYIAFVDSDDYIDSRMLSILQPYEGKYDIVQFGMVQENEIAETLGYINFPKEEVTGTENILMQYFSEYRMPSLACRIFRRGLFEKIQITGRNIGIDEIVTLQLMGRAESLISIDSTLYHIYVRTSSVSRSVYTKTRVNEIIAVHDFLWDYIKSGPAILKEYVLTKNIQAYLGMVASCEKDAWNEMRERVQGGIQKYTEFAVQCGIWDSVKHRLGIGFVIYQMNHGLYRIIRQIRRM